LIPLYGSSGAAVATGIAIAGINISRLWIVNRNLQIHPFHPNLLHIILAGMLACGLTWFLGKFLVLPTVVLIFIYTGIYSIFIWFCLNKEDKEIIQWFIQKVRKSV
jgi:O-antigen/teichoic acid export membrane protein